MIKRYDITIEGLARNTCPSRNWSSYYEIQTPEGVFTNRPNHPRPDICKYNLDKYNYYYPKSEEYLFISRLTDILKENGMVQNSKILFYNDYTLQEKNSDISTGPGVCMSYLSVPGFQDKTSLCLYWNRAGNTAMDNGAGDRGFYLINYNGNNVIGRSFNLSTFGSYGVMSSLVVIRNEKTGEFIVTQQKESCKNTYSYEGNDRRGTIDMLFGVFNQGSEKIIYAGRPDPRYDTFLWTSKGEKCGSLGLGSGPNSVLRNPPSNISGFYSSSTIGNNTSDSIALPFYMSKINTNSDNYYDIFLDKEIPSLKKVRGNFQEYQEYVLDNKLYYCVWQMNDYAILFDEGEVVSK